MNLVHTEDTTTKTLKLWISVMFIDMEWSSQLKKYIRAIYKAETQVSRL